MAWRFYVQRAATGTWLDNDAQLSNVKLTWNLTAPNSGTANIPTGLVANPNSSDGQKTWGKWSTLLYAEENGALSWVGICVGATPSRDGLSLNFMGLSAWLQRVPYTDVYSVWKTNVFDVVRHFIRHTINKKPNIPFILPNTNSVFSVADPQPPARPKAPARKKGQSMSEYYDTDAYKNWKKRDEAWVEQYGDYTKYEVAVYEGPYVGEEVDSLAKEFGFDYRERYAWKDKGARIPNFYFDFDDRIANRRTDFALVDGTNLSADLDTKDDDDVYANHVIGLGAGEGARMVRVEVGQSGDRLYQAEFMQYKNVKDPKRLRALAQADYQLLSSTAPKVDTVKVWNVPGFAPIGTLKVGDEVKLRSTNYSPPVDQWVRITSISRDTESIEAELKVETA